MMLSLFIIIEHLLTFIDDDDIAQLLFHVRIEIDVPTLIKQTPRIHLVISFCIHIPQIVKS